MNLIARTQEEKRGQVIRNQQERSLGLQGRDIADKQLQQATITLFLKEAGGGKMGSLIRRVREISGVGLPLLVFLVLLTGFSWQAAEAATVITDKPDYPPGETVWITGYGFAAAESVTVVVEHVDTTIVGGEGHTPWKVKANGSGSFLTYWVVPYDDNVGHTLRVKATGQTSGLVATTTFNDVNSLLSFFSIPDTVSAGDTFTVIASLFQNCGGGPDSALVGREILFFLTEANCGVDVGQDANDSSLTDTDGHAVGQLVIPTTGNWGVRIKFRGEDKPNPCPTPGNSACDPNDPQANKRCIEISASNECEIIVVVAPCDLNQPPVAGCPPNDTVFQCAVDTICVGPFTCTDPDNNLSSNTVSITPAVPYSAYAGGSFCFLPNQDATYSIQHICLDSCGEADTCLTYITVKTNKPPVVSCPSNKTVFLCQQQSVCVKPFTCTDPNNNVASHSVNFGTLSGDSVCFTPIAGKDTTYCIQYICTDSCGAADTCQTCVTVNFNDPPVASCPPNDTFDFLCEFDTICLNGFGCSDPNSNLASSSATVSPAVGYSSFVGGTFCFLPEDDIAYTIQHICVDSCGAEDTCYTTVTVRLVNDPPVASCPANDTFDFLCVPDTVCVGPFGCSDPDGNLCCSTATITPGVPYSNFDGTNFCFLPNKDTTYCIQHICLDSCGVADTCYTYVTIRFTNRPPTVSAPDGDTFLCGPDTLKFVVCATDPDAGDTITLEKTSGIGTFCVKTGPAPVCCTLSAFIPSAGTYDWIFKVTNGCGVTDYDTATWVITFNNPPTVKIDDGAKMLCGPDTLRIPVLGTDPDAGDTICVMQVSGPGSMPTKCGLSPVYDTLKHYITAGGTYTYVVKVTDECGAVDYDTGEWVIDFDALPPVVTAQDKTVSLCAPDTVRIEVCATDPDVGDTICLTKTSGSGTFPGKCGPAPTVCDTLKDYITVAGTYTYIFKATDRCGKVDFDTSTVVVTKVNRPPVVTAPDSAKFLCGPDSISFQVCASDPDVGDTITLEKTSGSGTFPPKTGVTPQCQTLKAYIPAAGTYTWIFKVTNSCGAVDFDTATWDIAFDQPPEAGCPANDTFVFNCKAETVCVGPFTCLDPDTPVETSYVTFGTLVGDQVCFLPADKDSTYEIKFICVDTCGKADTCLTNVTVRINHIHVKIDCIEGDPGQTKVVPIWLKTPVEIGGFQFCVEFNNTDLTVINVERGSAIDDTNNTGKFIWHYFTYRLNPSTVIHKYKICVVGIGKLYSSYPGICLQPDTQYVELAKIRFVLANNELLRCQQTPIVFEWDNFTCLENTFSDCSGYVLYVSNDPAQFDPDSCPAVDKNKNIFPCVVFENGCVKFRCPHDVDPIVIGDINVNGQPYEIGDAVLFANYFINGADGFSLDYDTRQAQVGATDINQDGYVLSIADLVYLIRILTGDQAPLGAGTGLVLGPTSNKASFDGRVVEVTADKALGAAWFVFQGEATVTPLVRDLTLIWKASNGQTKVLIYGMGKGSAISAGTSELFAINGKVELVKVEAADYYANPVEVQITSAGAAVPTNYLLSQNYPNPFNATTQISFALPIDANVSLTIFNLAGQVVKGYEEFMTAGYRTITWDGTNGNGDKVASGVYFYKLAAGKYTDIKKMTLLK